MDKKGDDAKGTTNTNPFVWIIFSHPFAVILLISLLTFVLPLVLLSIYPLLLGNDPEKGFETDGTPYSGPRLAWALLQPAIAHGSRVNFVAQPVPETRTKRSWADELVASFGSVACYDEPIPAMSFLSQFVVEVPSIEDVFSHQFLTQMCNLQQEMAHELAAFTEFSPFRTIWSLPNLMGCAVPANRANCSFLTGQDIGTFRKQFDLCLPHRKQILACHRHCQPGINSADEMSAETPCPNKFSLDCVEIPFECNHQMWFDLFYRILPEDLTSQPLSVNSILPFYSFTAYRLQGIDVPLRAFTHFEAKLKEMTATETTFQLKGLSMDLKRELLLDLAIRDSYFSLFALLDVFLLVCLYSMSLAFAMAVLLQLVAAVLSSLAIYRLFATELPLLNMIAFVLLISVGSDGAFLLLETFPPAERLSPETLGKTLGHTANTMFLTQFSTVVPFLLNLLSSVFAFRNFGLFAGLTLVLNYILLITFLPAFLVIQSHYLNPWIARFWPSRLWYCFPGSGSSDSLPNNDHVPNSHLGAGIFPTRVPSTQLDHCRHFVRTLLDHVLPSVLIQGRFIWLVSLLVILGFSAYLTATQLSLPRFNPLQLLSSSNLHEYYDQNAEQLFPFVADKIAGLPFSVRLVWGIRPASANNHFDPKSIGQLPEFDPRFRLDILGQVQALAEQLGRIRLLPFAKSHDKFWPEKFLEWSSAQTCSDAQSSSLCCNLESPLFSGELLDRCIRLSTVFLQTGYNDTLIWDNGTHRLAGYTALLHTRLPYSNRFANLSASFAQLDRTLFPSDQQVASLPGWYTTEWAIISQWFDLQRGIIADCKQSFVISFLVVLLFSAIMLRWKEALCATFTIFCIVLCTVGTLVFLGWEIGVLEGVILVLVVGLSFDYTLHFGAMVPDHGCAEHRVQQAVRNAIRPVGLSAVSSILAGAVILFAQTHAFYQVAIFLVVCSFISLIFAIFFFLPLIYIFDCAMLECQTFPTSGQQHQKDANSGGIFGRIRRRNALYCEWCLKSQERKAFKMRRLNG